MFHLAMFRTGSGRLARKETEMMNDELTLRFLSLESPAPPPAVEADVPEMRFKVETERILLPEVG